MITIKILIITTLFSLIKSTIVTNGYVDSFNKYSLIILESTTEIDFSKIEELKIGEACNAIALFIIPVETEKSILKAALEADISKIHYVETRNEGLYPLFYQSCVMVYGE